MLAGQYSNREKIDRESLLRAEALSRIGMRRMRAKSLVDLVRMADKLKVSTRES
jgi:hypothetical protein